MRYTLLELVKLLLSSMDSDEVNSFSDTVESNQVALLCKSVFYDVATELGLPEHDGLFELTASNVSTPTLMTVPTNVVQVKRISYNNKLSTESFSRYLDLEFVPFDEFRRRVTYIQDASDIVGEMSFTSNACTFEMLYFNDRMPKYFTSFDDYTIIFDAYDSAEDPTGLTKTKTMCYGSLYPDFTMADSFVPDLDPDQFAYYVNRAKVRAFAELKQAANSEAASETRNQKIRGQRTRRRVPGQTELNRAPNYGRR